MGPMVVVKVLYRDVSRESDKYKSKGGNERQTYLYSSSPSYRPSISPTIEAIHLPTQQYDPTI